MMSAPRSPAARVLERAERGIGDRPRERDLGADLIVQAGDHQQLHSGAAPQPPCALSARAPTMPAQKVP